ncbi:MAG: dipeptidase [Sphingomonas sp.]|uniref:dipeptidase n=1 Tax=Sphingomonas sp. TaxID=28214 RepID=UPI003F7DE07D
MDGAVALRDKSRALFHDALVWDTTLGWLMGSPHPETLPRFRAAGFDHISLTVGVDLLGPEIVLREMGPVFAMCAQEPNKYVLATDVASIDAAKKAGKLALTFNLQGTNGLGGNIQMVEIFYRLGVRSMLLAYNKRNLVGDGCAERTDAGLSRFGVRLVKEMNRVGMLVDGTHSGYRTTMEAMEIAEAPFIFSHSSAHAVYPHYRNIKDDQILLCAKTGGVIGVCGLWHDTKASTETMFRHIEHIAGLVGTEHIGLGLDYVRDREAFWHYVHADTDLWPEIDGKPLVETDFVQPEELEQVCEHMLRHGYTDEQVRGVLGENFRRVASQVWK